MRLIQNLDEVLRGPDLGALHRSQQVAAGDVVVVVMRQHHGVDLAHAPLVL